MTAVIKCDWCDQIIEPGETYYEITLQPKVAVNDGSISNDESKQYHLHNSNDMNDKLTCYQNYHM